MDDTWIVICKYCNRPEYYPEMHWLGGKCLCRDCYKREYEEHHGMYIWNDLDGKRPTMDEYRNQFDGGENNETDTVYERHGAAEIS